MRWFSLFRLVLVLSLALTTFSAATTEAAGLTLDVRSVDASQFPKVTTTVSLVDSLDVPLANLDRSALTLKEDDSTIQDVQIQPTIDPQQALAVALLVDTGSSMNDAGKLAAAKQALGAFVDALGPQDSAAVIAFSDQPKVVQGYTGDKNALKAAVNQLQAGGPHAIFDAVTQASQFQAALSQKRKVLLLLTDSGDTASKQTLDSASSAARNAHVPVYAVGLGSDVHHDLLDILAGQTAGQVTYVASADGLAKAFQDEATHFRRLYQLTYTSKLAGDDKSHTLTVTVKTQAQELTPQGTWQSHLETPSGQGSFTAKSNALDFDVAGIKTATQVSGTNPITVTLKSGQASQMQLLVDGQQRASLTAAPYAFPWDTTKETPGIHRVVIRAIGADGKPTDSEFIVQVLAPASAAPTTAPATTVAAVPTVAPAPVPAPPPPNLLLYGAAGAGVLLIAGGAAFGVVMATRRKPVAPAAPVQPVAPTRPKVEDRTEVIEKPQEKTSVIAPPAPVADAGATAIGTVVAGGTIVAGSTVVAGPGVPALPRARLKILQGGAESEAELTQAETIVGREATNPVPVRDPQASRRHARILIENGEFWIEDLKSLNGTRVNGELVTTRRKLVRGDQIKIGDTILTFIPE